MTARIQPGSIVVGVDGSKHGARALHWAVEQARVERRPLAVVTADHGLLDRSVTRINSDAVRLVGTTAPDVEVVGVTAVGDPRHVLADLSRAAHLVVVGSHGRGALRSLLLGSVSTSLLRIAESPVVICRPRAEDHAGRGVVVAADGTPDSLPILEFAFAQAAMHHQSLTVVHCLWDVTGAVHGARNITVEGADLGTGDEAHLLLAESIAGFAEKYPDVVVTERVVHGLVDDVIGGRTAAWDLIVVGRHPIDTIGRLITGAIATAVVERSHTSVSVVPLAK